MAGHFLSNIEGDVASVFLSYFQRAPEFEAMQHYVGVYEALQADPATTSNAFNLLAAHIYADGVASQEVPAGPTVSDAWYVAYLYSNILGRAPDTEGQGYWTAQLASGAIERAELVGTFIAAALAAEGRDAGYLANRTFVAVEFAQWENSNPQVLPTLKYDAAEVLLGVNENGETAQEALTRLETHTGPIGETKNLTTGIDTFEGTTGNDTFNAVFESNSASTLTNFDTIDGDLGTDTLNIYVGEGEDAANASFLDTVTVRNIEIVNVFNSEDSNASLRTVSNYEGVEEFWQIDTAASAHAVGDGVLVGFRNVDDLMARVELQNGVTTAEIALANVGTDAWDAIMLVTGRDLTTVDVTGTLGGADTELLLDVVAGKGVSALTISTDVETDLFVTVNVDSAANLRINTLDLSGSTGDIAFYIGENQASQLVGANAALNVTFGSGDDVIIFDARDLTLRDNIDGGEGYDTVVLTQDGKLQTQNYDTIARLQNIDRLAFGGDDVELDASELTDFDISLSGDGDTVVSNLGSNQVITVDYWDDEGPSSVTLKNAAADVTIEADGNASFLLAIDAASAGAKGGMLTLTGEGGTLFSNAASGKFSTIDATELEGYDLTYGEIAEFIAAIDATGREDEEVDVGLVLVSIDIEDFIGSFGSGMSGAVAETVSLNVNTLDVIAINVDLVDAVDSPWISSNSSTYGKMDVIENFNSDTEAGPLDYLIGYGNLEKLELGANDNTLQLAFQAAASAYEDGVLYFTFGGDTYLYADTLAGQSGQYDDADFALKILGEHDLTEQWVGIFAG